MNTILDFIIRFKTDESFKVGVVERGYSDLLAESDFSFIKEEFNMLRVNSELNDPHQRFENLKAFGFSLYKKIFTPETERVWKKFKDKSYFLTMCIRIEDKADKLEILPWETVFDGSEFICAGANTSLTRLGCNVSPIDSLPEVDFPVKMFALTSGPCDLEKNDMPDIEKEHNILLCATNSPTGQGKLFVEFEDEAKISVIKNYFKNKFDIFHYSGHGICSEHGGGLVLEDLNGRKKETKVNEIVELIEKGDKNIRLAVVSGLQTTRTLNADGFISLAQGLIRKIPGVLAMQFPITDKAWLLFSELFYLFIIQGRPLDRVVSAARRVLLEDKDINIRLSAFSPALFLRNNNPLNIKQPEEAEINEESESTKKIYMHLPELDSEFYGRQRECRKIDEVFVQKNYKAIIIHGKGGTGKTALIRHSALRLKDHFKRIYSFNCMSGIFSPDTILRELNEFFKSQENNDLKDITKESFKHEKLANVMAPVLSKSGLLVIFDNFECQLCDINGKYEIKNASLKDFLKNLIKDTDPETKFVFTSRYVFDLGKEINKSVENIELKDFNRSEAVGFMQSLLNLRSAFFRDKIRAYEIFGGNPHSLSMLNCYCRDISLAKSLDDARGIKVGNSEFISVEMNYSKLSERGARLLNRFAAFRTPIGFSGVHWSVGEGIKAPLGFIKILEGAIDGFDRRELPEEYHDMSNKEMIEKFEEHLANHRNCEDSDELANELISLGFFKKIKNNDTPVFAVHRIVRDFCISKLDKDVWSKNLFNAADYYKTKSSSGGDLPDEFRVFGKMQAFELLFEAEDFKNAALIVNYISKGFRKKGFSRLAEYLYKRVIPEVSKDMQGFLAHCLGVVYEELGDYKSALKCYRNSVKIDTEIGDKEGVVYSINQIGIIYEDQGNYEAALEYYKISLKLAEEVGEYDNTMASTLHHLGTVCYRLHDYKSSVKYYEKLSKVFEYNGNIESISYSSDEAGFIHYLLEDYESALKQYRKALKIREKLGDKSAIALSLYNIGMIYQKQGEYETALEKYKKSLKIEEELGNQSKIGTLSVYIGEILCEMEMYKDAFGIILSAVKILSKIDSPDLKDVIKKFMELREDWGPEEFDSELKKATELDGPDIKKLSIK